MLVSGVDFLAKPCTIFATACCDFKNLFSLLLLVLCGDLSATEFHNDFLSLFFVILDFVGRSVSGGVS
jgi:hypothetical protein